MYCMVIIINNTVLYTRNLPRVDFKCSPHTLKETIQGDGCVN